MYVQLIGSARQLRNVPFIAYKCDMVVCIYIREVTPSINVLWPQQVTMVRYEISKTMSWACLLISKQANLGSSWLKKMFHRHMVFPWVQWKYLCDGVPTLKLLEVWFASQTCSFGQVYDALQELACISIPSAFDSTNYRINPCTLATNLLERIISLLPFPVILGEPALGFICFHQVASIRVWSRHGIYMLI